MCPAPIDFPRTSRRDDTPRPMDEASRRRLHLALAWIALVLVCAVSAILGQLEEGPADAAAEEISAVATLKVAVATGNESAFGRAHAEEDRFPVLRLHGI